MKKQNLEEILWMSVVKSNENLVIPNPYDEINSFIEKNTNIKPIFRCAGAPLDNFLKAVINLVNPKIIIEVGSYVGYSACKMAEYCKQANIQDFSIICVDPWTDCTGRREFDERILGYPSFYYKFLYNVKQQGHDDVIIPFPMPSLTGYKFFKKANITPDLIYIDGSHDYDDVYLDLTRYYQILNSKGIICGDDWAWDTVKEAVTDACKDLNISKKLQIPGGVWYIQK